MTRRITRFTWNMDKALSIVSNSEKTLAFSVAAEVESPNRHTTWGHCAAITTRVRSAVREALININPPKYDRYTVVITRIGSSRMDDDNLVSACKPARDQLASWLGIDDGSDRIRWVYDQRIQHVIDTTPRAKAKYRRWIEVRVEPGPAGEGYPPGVISVEAEGGAGADTHANNANYIECNSNNYPSPAPGNNSQNYSGSHETQGITPPRLEREKKVPDVPADRGAPPLAEVELPTRSSAGSSRLRVSLLPATPATPAYVRVVTAYTASGIPWRTAGIRVLPSEVEALVAALRRMTPPAE